MGSWIAASVCREDHREARGGPNRYQLGTTYGLNALLGGIENGDPIKSLSELPGIERGV